MIAALWFCKSKQRLDGKHQSFWVGALGLMQQTHLLGPIIGVWYTLALIKEDKRGY